jgi:exosortase
MISKRILLPTLKLLGLVVVSLALAWKPGEHLFTFAWHMGEQSYILLIPVMVAGLIYWDRERIFATVRSGMNTAGGVAFALAAILIGTAYWLPVSSELQMAVVALGLMAFWVAAFLVCYGPTSARAAMFYLGLLICIVPLPAVCITAITLALQKASADVTEVLFRMTGVPLLRDGFVFYLPGQAIEVAKECSGIRSSLSMVILVSVLAHEALRSNWRRLVLVAFVLPITVLKNGVRIVTLTLLAIYVDPSFLTGRLHHEGGIVFFLLGLAMLLPVLVLLRRGDNPPERPPQRPEAAPAAVSG